MIYNLYIHIFFILWGEIVKMEKQIAKIICGLNIKKFAFERLPELDINLIEKDVKLTVVFAKITINDKVQILSGTSRSGNQLEAITELAHKIYASISGHTEKCQVDNTNKTNDQKCQVDKHNDKHNYSKETIEAMQKFKKDKDITTDEKFMSYINAWNPNIKCKSELNENLAKEFLQWVK